MTIASPPPGMSASPSQVFATKHFIRLSIHTPGRGGGAIIGVQCLTNRTRYTEQVDPTSRRV